MVVQTKLKTDTHNWKQGLCRVSTALGKGLKTLGKGFAERCTRHRPLGEKKVGKAFFAECHLSGTRQSLCRVSTGHSAKKSSR